MNETTNDVCGKLPRGPLCPLGRGDKVADRYRAGAWTFRHDDRGKDNEPLPYSGWTKELWSGTVDNAWMRYLHTREDRMRMQSILQDQGFSYLPERLCVSW